ncbi:DUF1707 domain-containing protein [Amycolatopsis sp. cmx-8-4]|uniref:DUF1707 SHOCT-like domain-containing protein n=1 Tax=Amycolatopsis sp. cmx-8-4 TaxID=2790947 RepID=UPI00397D047E
MLGATLSAGSTAAEGIRCSDAEREQVRAVLYAVVGEGRLTMDEVEERLARIEAARFRHELTGVTADLPGPDRNEPERLAADPGGFILAIGCVSTSSASRSQLK